MKLLRTIRVGNATIDVWQDEEGTIIVGGLGWVEYNDYEKEVRKKEG